MSRQAELDELRSELESLRTRRPFADVDRELNASIVPADLASDTKSQEQESPNEVMPGRGQAHRVS